MLLSPSASFPARCHLGANKNGSCMDGSHGEGGDEGRALKASVFGICLSQWFR